LGLFFSSFFIFFLGRASSKKGRVMSQKLDLDGLLRRMTDCRGKRVKEVTMTEAEIMELIGKARAIFLKQPMLLELEPPLKICGDTHGQFYDLLRLFQHGGFPPEANYLFLGDYVDRGKQNIENIVMLLAYKVKYPENFFLLRGNHECAAVNFEYGFYKDCKERYSIKLWKTFTDCWNCLPISAVVGDKIICMHGGISPHLQSLEQANPTSRGRPIRRPLLRHTVERSGYRIPWLGQ